MAGAGLGEDPVEKYLTLRRELENFSEELAGRPERVVITKTDVTEVKEGLAELRRRFDEEAGVKIVWAISSVAGEGIKELVKRTGELVLEMKESS